MTRNNLVARPVWVIALLVALMMTVALLACGGSSDEEETESPEPTATPATATTTATPVPASEPTTAAMPTSTQPAAPTGPRQMGDVEGITFQVGEGSEATFTVTEQLASLSLPNDAVVRTNALSGHVSLDGQESVIEIDLLQLSSDSSYRDRYIRERMFANHPTGTFTVQGLDELPDGFADGDMVSAQVDGDLTVRGITTPLTFDVEARDDGDVVFIIGRTTFSWDQLQIPKPTANSVVSVEDEVGVEVLLAARPVTDSMAMAPTTAPEPPPAPAGTPPPAPAGTPPPAPASTMAPSMPSSSVLIVPPLDGNAQAFLDQLPSGESICVSGALTPEQLATVLGPLGPAGPEGAAFLGCLSDRSIVRITLGIQLGMAGGLSPETETCLNSQLDNEATVGSVAGGFRAQIITGVESPVAMFVMVPFMQCLNPTEAATAGLGDPAQIQCIMEELGPEGLAALSEPPDPAAGPPVALMQAAMKCMGPGP